MISLYFIISLQGNYIKSMLPAACGFLDGMCQYPDEEDLINMLKPVTNGGKMVTDKSQPRFYECTNVLELEKDKRKQIFNQVNLICFKINISYV